MILLADCDIIIKLIAADLMHDFMKMTHSDFTDIYVAPATRYSLGGRTRRNLWGNAAIKKAVAFAYKCQIVTFDIPEEREALSLVDNIDDGELVLFSATNKLTDAFIATGDKKCLRALYGSADSGGVCEEVYNGLRNLDSGSG